jgi:hypothetical protein
MRTEIEILENICLNTIKGVIGNTIPTKNELQEYIDIQKNKYNLSDTFDKLVFSEIVHEIQIG